MELFYLSLPFFIIYFLIGLWLIFKNIKTSTSGTYLGIFFISFSFGPLVRFLFEFDIDKFYVLGCIFHMFFQSYLLWFYFYIHSVLGNRISKREYFIAYLILFCTTILAIYLSVVIAPLNIDITLLNIYPFQLKDSFILKLFSLNYLFKIFLFFVVVFLSNRLLSDFKRKGFVEKSKEDLYKWLTNIFLVFTLNALLKFFIFCNAFFPVVEQSYLNPIFIVFNQVLLLFIAYLIYKFPLISLGVPVSKKVFKPTVDAIDKDERNYLFDSSNINQKLILWERHADSYLNKNFNLVQLSKEVEIDELEILYYLHEYNEISFNDYLNFLRITFVVEKLKVNYLENHTLLDLAKLAGFKSEEHLEEIFRRIMNSSIKSFKSNE